MRMEDSGEALWRGSSSGMEVDSFYWDRGGASSLRRSGVGAGTDFRRGVICRQGSICRMLQVSGPRMVSWRWLGLGVRSRIWVWGWTGICRCVSVLFMGQLEWLWDTDGRRRTVEALRQLGAGGRSLRSQSSRFWIGFRAPIGLKKGLHSVVVMRRCRVAARRRRATWGRSGAGAGRSMLAWWASALGLWERWWMGRASAVWFCCCFLFHACLFVLLSVVSLSVITSNRVPVGGSGLSASGLCASLCTLCAFSALGWRRLPCSCKWLLPLSNRGNLSVTGCSVRWQHNGKAVHMVVMLCCSRVADQVIFPLCLRCITAVKANRVASCALFAS
ncbi:hypothetical protein RchiOBHm_Chr4g0413331 [Rosa chinensis]|uniref:Uncharacterized protein n=1 Tax=Rosa chinensis TaxID=74649 RepID=A0A2P6QW45_ROSCH|nr:hypothetical protein RchiOBHm_Chr4g0413331 [Rosa chinensis]